MSGADGDGEATEVSADGSGRERRMRRMPTGLLTGAKDDVIPPATALGRFDAAVNGGGCARCWKYQFERAGHSLTLQSRREIFFDLAAGSAEHLAANVS